MKKELNAISLFTCTGVGDLGLHANGINTVVACELLADRLKLFQENNPDSKCFQGDIWDLQTDIIEYYRANFRDAPFMVLATPPCQGMSTGGKGKLMQSVRNGKRPEMDPRNRLIIPAVAIIKALQPEYVLFENVVGMQNTIILDENDEPVNIIEYVHRELGDSYVGEPVAIDCVNYGVPQHRTRLITVLSRSEKAKAHYAKYKTFMPPETHSKNDLLLKPWVSLRDAIGHLPELRAEAGKNIDKTNSLHKVPLMSEEKLWWFDNTSEGCTAFNNQCVNPDCMYQGNARHGNVKSNDGTMKSNLETPTYCSKCGSLLPRPSVTNKETGKKRIIKGFTTAYKRLKWDEPAGTLTMNLQCCSSDTKIHPEQSRVLSLYEGTIVQTIADYGMRFCIDGVQVSDVVLRDLIGESIPPRVTDLVCKHILEIEGI